MGTIVIASIGFLGIQFVTVEAAETMKVHPQLSHEEGTSAPTYDPTTAPGSMKVYPQESSQEGSRTTGYPVDEYDRERQKTLEEMLTEEETSEKVPQPFDPGMKVHPLEKQSEDPTDPVDKY